MDDPRVESVFQFLLLFSFVSFTSFPPLCSISAVFFSSQIPFPSHQRHFGSGTNKAIKAMTRVTDTQDKIIEGKVESTKNQDRVYLVSCVGVMCFFSPSLSPSLSLPTLTDYFDVSLTLVL